MIKTKLICLPLLALVALNLAELKAQSKEEQLTATILHLDSAFWNAYNNCDTAKFKDFVTDDVEFYHDKGGITLGAMALIESLKKNICGNANQKVRREAVAATVKVFPMANGNELYGALISGEHEFHVSENNKPEYHVGDAGFTQLWIVKNGVWKMSRILSFNHHEAQYKNKRTAIELTPKELNQFSGTYKSSKSNTMTVTRQKNVLLLKGGDNTFTLYPLSQNSFFTKERDLEFHFVKDTAGKPLKMIVKEKGAVSDELVFEK
jgi:hypothetical protein